ncbi:MAG TPA: MFS transporter, partial [Microthrixaceae bacterium]|nr:MFS transporter [Microthrixaceae bacterium]
FLQMVLEYNAMEAGLAMAPLSLTMFGVTILAARKSGGRRPASIIRAGFALLAVGLAVLIFLVPSADSGWTLIAPLAVMGVGWGLMLSQLNNYTLAPVSAERVSEAASVNSASGSFGLSFGLAMAGGIMLASLSIIFTDMAESSTVLDPAEQQQVAQALEDDAELMSNTKLEGILEGQPADVQDEILRINDEARPLALQLALIVPLVAGVLGLANGFRMLRLPDIEPAAELDGMDFG